MENPFRQLPFRTLAILALAMILVTGTLVSLARGHFNLGNYTYALTYTVACAFWVGLILGFSYSFIARQRRALFYLLFALLVLAGTALGTQTASLIIHKRLYAGPRITAFTIVVSLGLSILAVANEHLRQGLSKKVASLKEADIESKILERCEIEARMNSLHAKLDPQFLVNTLDTVAGLVREDPTIAERNIKKLSNLYRRALSLSKESRVELSEEIALIKDYLELEGRRLGKNLRATIDCPTELMDARIPGLLLEPLVENAIKHGSSGKPLNIRMSVWKEGQRVIVRVADDGRGFDQSRTPFGLGLFGIQQRLKLIYGSDYSFEIESEVGRGTSVTLGLPMSGALT